MKRTILLFAIALMASVTFGQKKDFKQLAQIEGVEHVNINKTMLNLAIKNGGQFDFGETFSINGVSNILNQLERITIYSSEAQEATKKMNTQASSILSGSGWEQLLSVNEEDVENVRIYQSRKGQKSTLFVYRTDEEESELMIIEGSLDLIKLIQEEIDENKEE